MGQIGSDTGGVDNIVEREFVNEWADFAKQRQRLNSGQGQSSSDDGADNRVTDLPNTARSSENNGLHFEFDGGVCLLE